MWNKLADDQHLTRLEETDNPELVAQMLEPSAYEHVYEHPGEDELYDLEPGWTWEKKGTKILYNTLMRVGAKWYRCPLYRNGVVVKRVKRLWLPAHFHNEVVGHIAAYTGTKPNKIPYSNSSGQWASHYFFGFDEAWRLSSQWKKNGFKRFCFVVEGPRDCLVMLQNRIPAVATMGTNSWTEAKANILALEFDHVFACGDGDMAGKKMNKAIKQMLGGSISVTKVKLEPETDPAGLTEEDYRQITGIIKRHAV
jgi:5S rRNA maturation endonuclease (ribonuclease M5)